MSTPFPAPIRAPALYVSGFVEQETGDVVPFSFRLPCPPVWGERRPVAWAAERRARRAYFATLDALRTGVIDPTEEAKIGRLLQDLRSSEIQDVVRHFQRILDHVRRRSGRPTIAQPPSPMLSVVISAPSRGGPARAADLEARYRWALDWLEARRFVAAGKELRAEWRVRKPSRGVKRRGVLASKS